MEGSPDGSGVMKVSKDQHVKANRKCLSAAAGRRSHINVFLTSVGQRVPLKINMGFAQVWRFFFIGENVCFHDVKEFSSTLMCLQTWILGQASKASKACECFQHMYNVQLLGYCEEWLRLVRDSEPDMITPVRVHPAYLTSWIRMMIANSFHPQVFRKANLSAKDLYLGQP